MKILLKIEVNDKDINKDEIIEFLKSNIIFEISFVNFS